MATKCNFKNQITNKNTFQDFIDLSPPDASSDTSENVTAADVCLYGLNIIMPLMSAELLKFPNLCLQYFKTITFVCEIYPEKVVTIRFF